MPGVVASLFGPPSARPADADEQAPQLGVKGLALLAYLILEPGPHEREELAALLWGESPDDDARASLRQALLRLRRLAGDALHADRHSVELAGPIRCDVCEFIAAAERRDPSATGFPVARFLEGLAPHGAPGFEEWAAGRRRRLLQRYQNTLRAAVRDATTRSRWREALELADRWLACDPLSEEATGVALEALHCLGDRSGALVRYRDFRELLRRELGSRPSDALADLAKRIELAAPRAATAEPADADPLPRFDADLVGRESQWLALTQTWEPVGATGSGRVALIEGEHGAGKSRLADEFTRWAAAHGATTLRGQAWGPAGEAPFGTIGGLLRSALSAPGLAATDPEWLAETARLLPEFRRRFPSLPEPRVTSGPEERWRLLEGIAEVVLALAAEQPVVLLLDDLQWCDAESCACLHHLLRRLSEGPILMLATVTAGEPRRGTPVYQLVRALAADPRATVVALQPLAEADVWRLIRQLGNVRTPTGAQHFARRLHALTDGNPFHVVETLKTLFSQGLLAVTPISREWVVPAEISPGEFARIPLPRSVREAIEGRVARLQEEHRDLLALVAVAERPVAVDVLSHAQGMSRLRIAALADGLVERHMVEEADRAYRVAHPVVGEVVRAGLTAARLVELHRALAAALAAAAAPEEVAGTIAFHAARGGDAERARRFALLAADAAEARAAWDEALGWLSFAARTDPGARADLEARAGALSARAGWAATPSLETPSLESPDGPAPAPPDLRSLAPEP